jgi:hypothetical protein
MTSRTYALILSLVGILLFLAVACANVIVDPEFVFATKLLTRTGSGNERLERFRAYEAAPDRYDGLLFGSSRAHFIPLDELSKRTDGVTFASFSVGQGLLSDHVPVLEYILRQKASGKTRLRAVFLLLDIDFFGTPPLTNQFNYAMLPPALMGESEIRFLWRHLTAIQFKTWRSRIRQALSGSEQPILPLPQYCFLAEGKDCAAAPVTAPVPTPAPAPAPTTAPTAAPADAPVQPAPQPQLLRITDRIDFRQQLALLDHFAALCRANGVRLVVAIAPLFPSSERQFDSGDLDDAIDRIGALVPVWDFSHASDWPSDHADLWLDTSHFLQPVGLMMLRRIFDKDMPPEWEKFGRSRSRSTRNPGQRQNALQ